MFKRYIFLTAILFGVQTVAEVESFRLQIRDFGEVDMNVDKEALGQAFMRTFGLDNVFEITLSPPTIQRAIYYRPGLDTEPVVTCRNDTSSTCWRVKIPFTMKITINEQEDTISPCSIWIYIGQDTGSRYFVNNSDGQIKMCEGETWNFPFDFFLPDTRETIIHFPGNKELQMVPFRQ